jgi:hypothetical protein
MKEGRDIKVYRVYSGEKDPELITFEIAIEMLEGHGYYAKGSVKGLLESGEQLRSNAATYYAVKK